MVVFLYLSTTKINTLFNCEDLLFCKLGNFHYHCFPESMTPDNSLNLKIHEILISNLNIFCLHACLILQYDIAKSSGKCLLGFNLILVIFHRLAGVFWRISDVKFTNRELVIRSCRRCIWLIYPSDCWQWEWLSGLKRDPLAANTAIVLCQ